MRGPFERGGERVGVGGERGSGSEENREAMSFGDTRRKRRERERR